VRLCRRWRPAQPPKWRKTRAFPATEAKSGERRTLRWRGLNSNFQYAGAVNLVVAPFMPPNGAISARTQFVRFVPDLADRAGLITLAVPGDLMSLMRVAARDRWHVVDIGRAPLRRQADSHPRRHGDGCSDSAGLAVRKILRCRYHRWAPRTAPSGITTTTATAIPR
jgi:hypothetical protein